MAITGTLTATMIITDSTNATSEVDTLTFLTPTAITSITEKDKRTEQLTTTARTILIFAATVGAGQFTSWKGVLFINRDTTNTVILGFIDTGLTAHYIQIPPGRFYMMNDSKMQNNATGGAYVAPMIDVDSVTAATAAGTAQLEYLYVG